MCSHFVSHLAITFCRVGQLFGDAPVHSTPKFRYISIGMIDSKSMSHWWLFPVTAVGPLVPQLSI